MARRIPLNPKSASRGLCVNGCNRPVKAPSKVLCARCFDELDQKIRGLCLGFLAPATDGGKP